MKRFVLVSILLIGLSPFLVAQKVIRLGKGGHKVNKPTVSSSQVFRQVSSPTVSVLGYFHRAGNMEFWQPPVAPTRPNPPQSRQTSFTKRSRESLELELSARGFESWRLKDYSRDEMEKLLSSYGAFKAAEEVHSRYETEPEGETFAERSKRLKRWAETQPDYFKENYLDYDEVAEEYEDWRVYSHYTAPFHPAVESLRILLVRDSIDGVFSLYNAVKQFHPEVLIYRADSVEQALEKLAHNYYDIILTDFVLGEHHNGFEISMYVWNKKLNIPVVSYSTTPMDPHVLLKYNIVGEIPLVFSPEEGERALSYLSNVAVTGRAYPAHSSRVEP